jgi:hypothetical protein
MGAAMILVPHKAELPPTPPLPAADLTLSILVDERSGAICKRAVACVFKHHQHSKVRVYVLGQWRDDGAGSFIVGGSDSGTCGDVQHGRRSAADNNDAAENNADGDADDILC